MDVTEAVEALTNADSVDEVKEALEGTPVHKAIRRDAYKEGQQDKEQELSKAQDKIASLRKEKQNLETKIENLEDERPDEAELIGKYEEKLDQKNQKIQELQEEKDEVESDWRSRTQSVKTSTLKERVASSLKAEGVDEDYADFRAEKIVSSGRVTFNDDLEPQAYEDEDGTVPLHTNGEPVHEALASDAIEEVPDKFIEDNRPGETGLGQTGSGGSGRTISRDEFESMSADERKQVALDDDVQVVSE